MRDLDRYQAEYLANYGFERHMVRYRRKLVLERIAEHRHDRILEVGCGLEPLFEHLDDWRSYTIVEPGREFAARASAKIPAGRDVLVHQGILEDAAVALHGRAFDLIVVSSLLHEVQEPARLLTAVRALCGPDTVVHINVPNARSLHNVLAVKMGLLADVFGRSPLADTMQRTGTFDLAALTDLVATAGFSVVANGTYFLKPFTHGQLQRMLEQQIIDERVLDALFDVVAELPGLGAELYVDVKPA